MAGLWDFVAFVAFCKQNPNKKIFHFPYTVNEIWFEMVEIFILFRYHCSKFKKKNHLFSLCSLFPTTYFDQISPNLWPKQVRGQRTGRTGQNNLLMVLSLAPFLKEREIQIRKNLWIVIYKIDKNHYSENSVCNRDFSSFRK